MGITYEDKQNLLKAADQDKSGTIEFNEFADLFSDVDAYNTVAEQRAQINLRTNLHAIFEKAHENEIDVEALFLKYDVNTQGALQVIDFRDILKNLPFGILQSEIDHILKYEVTYTDNGRIDYQKIIHDPQFTKGKVIAKLKLNTGDVKDLLKQIQEDEHYFEPQKILIESVIYVDDYDLMIYTTALPRTSTIFLSSAKTKIQSDNPGDSHSLFNNKLLARLEGHRSGLAPTIKFIDQTGCLISGDKIEKKMHVSSPKGSNPLTNAPSKESYMSFYQNIEVSKQYSADIMIWNFEKNLFDLCNTNPPWSVVPTHIIRGAHYDSILDICYLTVAQLIVTASADHTIKMWDPVARAYSLKHPKNISLIRKKPGVYETGEEQYTTSNANSPK